ncbi:MAG: ABC transporter ATP-binding protein [Phycisphaerales bacterium]|nr:ABC transporter ATP-binding protein [Phycisphaerales bacterium]
MQVPTMSNQEDHGSALMRVRSVRFGYAPQRDTVGPVSVEVEARQVWAILGANGAGKSTLLKLMAGLLPARSGDIELLGRPLNAWSPRERARCTAYLPQHAPSDMPISALDVVLLGRHPFRALNFFESAEDHGIAEASLVAAGLPGFSTRALATLSGGEARRVHVAACLAQQPRLMLLDEPTASLDVKHQLEILGVVERRVREGGGAAVIVLHDVNLALRFCTHALLLAEGRVAGIGEAGDVVQPEVLQAAFDMPFSAATTQGGASWLVPEIQQNAEPRG